MSSIWAIVVLGAGMLTEAIIFVSSLTDEEDNARVVATMLREEGKAENIRSAELRARVGKALEYRRMIAKAIRTAHPEYKVTEANDGFQAGTLVAMVKPNVVILDLRMPGMDGFEVCRLIKSQPATEHATVIAITAYPSEESDNRILMCGAAKCLHKPLDLEELLAEIEAALEPARK